MQLASTLFGVLVVQIKPQLEKILNLPADSLTKETKLNQDLMELFIKYQIPSDLLSYDTSSLVPSSSLEAVSVREKLQVVKGHVAAMHEMIGLTKKQELTQRQDEAKFSYSSATESDESSLYSDDDEEGDNDSNNDYECFSAPSSNSHRQLARKSKRGTAPRVTQSASNATPFACTSFDQKPKQQQQQQQQQQQSSNSSSSSSSHRKKQWSRASLLLVATGTVHCSPRP